VAFISVQVVWINCHFFTSFVVLFVALKLVGDFDSLFIHLHRHRRALRQLAPSNRFRQTDNSLLGRCCSGKLLLVAHQVVLKVYQLRVGLGAVWAVVGFLPRVNEAVPLELGRGGEAFAALQALVFSLAIVHVPPLVDIAAARARRS